MKRFKYTGERLKQLQKKDLPQIREGLYQQAERELGRQLTDDEMKRFDKTAREIAKLPKYGG